MKFISKTITSIIYAILCHFFEKSSNRVKVWSYDVVSLSREVTLFWGKEMKNQLTWSLVVGILFTAGVRLSLWMMVLMSTMSPLPWQMHAHVHRVRPVTWKQMKEIPRHAVSLNQNDSIGGARVKRGVSLSFAKVDAKVEN